MLLRFGFKLLNVSHVTVFKSCCIGVRATILFKQEPLKEQRSHGTLKMSFSGMVEELLPNRCPQCPRCPHSEHMDPQVPIQPCDRFLCSDFFRWKRRQNLELLLLELLLGQSFISKH